MQSTLPVATLQQALSDNGIFGAIETAFFLVVLSATENNTDEEINKLIEVIKSLL